MAENPKITCRSNSFDHNSLQMLDNDKSSSILEFFARNRTIPDHIVNSLFLALPITNPISFSLKKYILIRKLSSDLVLRTVSEKTLKMLELIEEIDRNNNQSPPSEAMKLAYCAVASCCTTAAFRENVDGFFDSFHRIWVLRICDIDKSAAAGLISEELREVRDVFWEVVKDPKLRVLVNGDDLEETLELLRDYLEEVWDIESDCRLERDEWLDSSIEKGRDLKSTNLDGQRIVLDDLLDPRNKATKLLAESSEACTKNFKENDVQNKRDELIQTDGDGQALKASYLDLQRMLQKALLNAKNNAIEVQVVNLEEECSEELRVNDCPNRRDEVGSTPKIATNDTSIEGNGTSAMLNQYSKSSSLKEKEENQNGQDVLAMMDSFNKVPDVTPDEEDNTNKKSTLASLPRVSLMDRNTTAHTTKWTDSPPEEGRFHLPSPKRKLVSPLKLIDDKINNIKRRKTRKWTTLEIQTLLKAVRDHGKGSWKAILSNYTDIFEGRTEIDLKDKWRNMTK